MVLLVNLKMIINVFIRCLQGRMRTMVQLLTGFFRYENGDAPFNMLEDVFSKQGIDSGEAERVLVSAFFSKSRQIGSMKCIWFPHGLGKRENIFRPGNFDQTGIVREF